MDQAHIDAILSGADVQSVVHHLNNPAKGLPEHADVGVRQLPYSEAFIADIKSKSETPDKLLTEASNAAITSIEEVGHIDDCPLYAVYGESKDKALFYACGDFIDLREDADTGVSSSALLLEVTVWAKREGIEHNALREYAESKAIDGIIFDAQSLVVFSEGAVLDQHQYKMLYQNIMGESQFRPVPKVGSGWMIQAGASRLVDGACPVCRTIIEADEVYTCYKCGEHLKTHPLEMVYANAAYKHLAEGNARKLPHGTVTVSVKKDQDGRRETSFTVESFGHLLDATQEKTVIEGAKLVSGNRANVCAVDGAVIRSESIFDKGSLRSVFVYGQHAKTVVGRRRA